MDRTDIGRFEVSLSLVSDRRLFANDIELAFTASFDIELIEDDGSGGVYNVVFTSDFDGVFEFQLLPDWITADVATFSDGDTVELTIAESFTLERNIDLVAINSDIDLTATITVVQEEGTVTDGITSVDPDSFLIAPGDTSTYEIDVVCSDANLQWQPSSSQGWVRIVGSAIYEGSTSFEVLMFNVTALSPQAIVTVTNINNPSDFKTITFDTTA